MFIMFTKTDKKVKQTIGDIKVIKIIGNIEKET